MRDLAIPCILLAVGTSGAMAQRPSTPAAAATTRPVPYPVFEPRAFARAVELGTRTRTGQPGPNYWQQYARYDIAAELDSVTGLLTGHEEAWYLNRSPDTLRVVLVQLYHNIFAPGGIRNQEVPPGDPIAFSTVSAQGVSLQEGRRSNPGYFTNDTWMAIRLPQPILPGDSAPFTFGWSFTVQPNGDPRGGRLEDGTHFVAYWYPQFVVYDDVNGWQNDPYLGNAEFYMGYGDYDVALTVPAGWLVAATGALVNADEVLSRGTRARLARARTERDVVHVVTDQDRGPGRATTTGTDGKLTWRFHAANVRDVDWGTSPHYLWDATVAAVGDRDGDGRADSSNIFSFYRPQGRSSFWQETARYGRHSIEFLSRFLWPYPYPHMTTVDGPNSCGGMEYPMVTCIGGQWDSTSMYEVVVHEIGHMWFPMQVGSDEKRFPWMDEGLTQFDQSQGMADFFPGYDDERRNRFIYERLAQAGGETEMMRHGDLYPNGGAYGIASYFKPATLLVTLRGLLGEETFLRAYREYGRRWAGKHPTPYDFFNTFNDVSGRDLSWFWRTWFFETWTLDQAMGDVRTVGDSLEVTIEDRGLAPMPVLLAVTRAGGATERITIPVERWLTGATRLTVRIAAAPAVTRIAIDPDNLFPDLDRSNQTWQP